MWGNRNALSLLVGMQHGIDTLEGGLMVSYKTEHTLAHDPAIALFGIYPKELKTYVHTNACTQCLQQLYHNCQNLEATKDASGG